MEDRLLAARSQCWCKVEGEQSGYKRTTEEILGVMEMLLFLDHVDVNILVVLFYSFARCYYLG